MKPSTQSIYEISSRQSWRQEEDSREDGERLQNLQSLTSSSSRMPRIQLRFPKKISKTTTLDIINQALKILEEDDDDSRTSA
jgi:hypothetical protein